MACAYCYVARRKGHGNPVTVFVKAQLACEVLMLTHNAALHEVNMAWHPKAEALLWRPDLQEAKHSENGQANLRCRAGWKGQWLRRLLDRLRARMPYCRVRYAF